MNKKIGDVKSIELYQRNGWTYPVFTMTDGRKFVERLTPTGSCWVLDWRIEIPEGDSQSLT